MKVGIFGDSYATESMHKPYDINYDHEGLPWSLYLKKISNYEITNFAVAGSSFQYSAKLFLEHYKNFDKCIFIVTVPGRVHLTNPNIHSKFKHIAGLAHLNSIISNNINRNADETSHQQILNENRHYLDALEKYYLYIYDYDQLTLFHNALVEKIAKTLPDSNLLLVPVHCDSIPGQITTMGTISDLDGSLHQTHRDIRKNHLNDNNNREFAKQIFNWTTTGSFKLDIINFHQSSHTLNQMWEKNEK
jgi:hypothetical protein